MARLTSPSCARSAIATVDQKPTLTYVVPGASGYSGHCPSSVGAGRRSRNGHNRHLVQEPPQELRSAFDGDLDVLDDTFARRSPSQRVEPGHRVVTVLQRDDLLVDVAAQIALGHQSAHARVLHAQRAGAPEPVGVPPPEVVPDSQPVLATLPQR